MVKVFPSSAAEEAVVQLVRLATAIAPAIIPSINFPAIFIA